MFFDTGSVSKQKLEVSLTTVIIKMKENQGKVLVHEFILEYIHNCWTLEKSLTGDI